MRISEALALEAKHFINGGRTILVQQQVGRDRPQIIPYVKTNSAYREVDLCTQVACYLRAFSNGRDGLLFRTRNGTPHLYHNLEERWLTPKLKKMGLEQPGMRWHAFKRSREIWLRHKRCQREINNFWLAHKPKTMSELSPTCTKSWGFGCWRRSASALVSRSQLFQPAPRIRRNPNSY